MDRNSSSQVCSWHFTIINNLITDSTKKAIDMDRMIILEQGRQIAEQLIEGNKDKLIEIVNHLNKHEVITDEGLATILGAKLSDEE